MTYLALVLPRWPLLHGRKRDRTGRVFSTGQRRGLPGREQEATTRTDKRGVQGYVAGTCVDHRAVKSTAHVDGQRCQCDWLATNKNSAIMYSGIQVCIGRNLNNRRLVGRQFVRRPCPDSTEGLAHHDVTALGRPERVRVASGPGRLSLIDCDAIKETAVRDRIV